MSLSQAIIETQACSDNFNLSFGVLTEHLPTEWVKTSLSLSTHATLRRRRLPEDMVLWLVIGMAMFRNEPISEVARRLNIWFVRKICGRVVARAVCQVCDIAQVPGSERS